MEAYWIFMGITSVVGGIIWGCVTKHINENKGYYGGFAWGFWLGLIGLIVVLAKPDNRYSSRQEDAFQHPMSAASRYDQELREQRMLKEGGWKCLYCEMVNPHYATSCGGCGHSLKESQAKMKEDENQKSAHDKDMPDTDALKKYQKMHEEGLITEEEYCAKRRQILGL